jgi:hypothetical protein
MTDCIPIYTDVVFHGQRFLPFMRKRKLAYKLIVGVINSFTLHGMALDIWLSLFMKVMMDEDMYDKGPVHVK